MSETKAVGIVLGGAGTDFFQFLYKKQDAEFIRVNSYVIVPIDNENNFLARILEIETIEKPRIPLVLSDLGVDLSGTKFDLISLHETESSFFARSEIIGVVSTEGFTFPRHPPIPSSFVYSMPSTILSNILGVKTYTSITLGRLIGSEENVWIDKNIFFKHVAILGMTGTGKSTLTQHLLTRLLQKDFKAIVFDKHGEYSKIRDKIERTMYFSSNEFAFEQGSRSITFTVDDDSLQSIIEYLDLMSTEKERVIEAYSEVQIEYGSYSISLDQIIDKIIKSEPRRRSSIFPLINGLRELAKSPLFEEREQVIDLVKAFELADLLVFDLSSVPFEFQELVTSIVLKKCYHSRSLGKISPLLLVFDDIQSFDLKKSELLTKDILRISTYGSKYNIGIILVSNRPSFVNPKILSQCGTIIALKIVNSNDKSSLTTISEFFGKIELNSITRLIRGQALVATSSIPFPIFIEIESEPIFFDD